MVLEQQVYDPQGQLLASAVLSAHQFDPVHQVSLPREVQVQLPPAQMGFTLQVSSYTINQLSGDPAQLWAMPQIAGTNYIDIALRLAGQLRDPGLTYSATRRDWRIFSSAAERGADAIFRDTGAGTDFVVGSAFEVIQSHDFGIPIVETREQALHLVAIADALFGGVSIAGRFRRGRTRQRNGISHFDQITHHDSTSDHGEVGGQTAIAAKRPQHAEVILENLHEDLGTQILPVGRI